MEAGENYSVNSKEYYRRVLKSGGKRFDSRKVDAETSFGSQLD